MKTYEENFDVIVVGGGASGMMAAGRAAERGKSVLILEKNFALGEKLKITGGGRCNVTNATYDIHKMLENYGEASKFLYSTFAKFGVKDTFEFFESRGLPLVVEARDRAFPETMKAYDVYKVLVKYIRKNKVHVITDAPVTKIGQEDGEITYVIAEDTKFVAKKYILATGGLSHPETGSTGDGLKWLAKLGHNIQKPNPSVVPLKVKNQWVKDLSGVSLSFMKITFFMDGQKAFSKIGKILFTHFGLSGPLVLNSSTKVKALLDKGDVTATIDAYPDTNLGLLEKQIIKVFDANKNKNLKTIFPEIVPEGMTEVLLGMLKLSEHDTKVHSVSKEGRKEIIHLLKNLPIKVEGLMGFDRAVISDGGVMLDEVDTKTMQSKLFKNLYFTGDLLNINRNSGGYSLQICWTTGFVAGDNV